MSEIGISLRRNKFGNYVHFDTGFVFDKHSKSVIGKQSDTGEIIPLTVDDIESCKLLNFKTEVSNENSLTFEQKYKKLLIDYLVSKWEEKINILSPSQTTYGMYSSKIRNIHGLEFDAYEISYCKHNKKYIVELHINYSIDGIITSENENTTTFSTSGFGSTVREAFTSIIESVNKYIFCKSCGIVRRHEFYSDEHSKCDACMMNELLSLDKKKSEYCSICLESTKNYYTLRCGHKFHRECISELENKICPNCRKSINNDSDYDEE